ncbi:MAG: hypothetical protein GY716_02200 [bacterium]|nr:hypothetical protein [bacterium]
MLQAFERWKAARAHDGSLDRLEIGLAYTKGLSSRHTSAYGKATLDLRSGSLQVGARGLPASANEGYDIWLVDRRDDRAGGEETDSGSRRILAGHMDEIAAAGDGLRCSVAVPMSLGFQIDLIVVAPAGAAPEERGLLFGVPSLFQRLRMRELQGRSVGSGTLGALVEQGEDLFFNETFDGNGRTCGTCHPITNNLTIDVEFIDTLPQSDPLFVAENNPALAQLENPIMMREFGLILENIDGFEDPTNKFVMRSVPHVRSMAMTIASDAAGFPQSLVGWSGDGAPDAPGDLRAFAIGAVTQHFPKTLNRVSGTDFRPPTDPELDAIEAFLLSLGRDQELDLENLRFIDPRAVIGREIFTTTDTVNGTVIAGKCTLCHSNAGAISELTPGINESFDTGVETLGHPADGNGEPRPPDGGFGVDFDPATGGFGDGTFNPPPLVEAADTLPFFHNNVRENLDDAISFYNDEFNTSPAGLLLASMDSGGIGIVIEDEAVNSLFSLLYVVNIRESLRLARQFQLRASELTDSNAIARLLGAASAEIDDAVERMDEDELHLDLIPQLEQAKTLTATAQGTADMTQRNALLAQAMTIETTARDAMVNLRVLTGTQPAGLALTAENSSTPWLDPGAATAPGIRFYRVEGIRRISVERTNDDVVLSWSE